MLMTLGLQLGNESESELVREMGHTKKSFKKFFVLCRNRLFGKRIQSDLLNELIKRHSYQKYLELGMRDDLCFTRIRITYKVGVDPRGHIGKIKNSFIHHMDFIQFFEMNKERFDLVLIDGGIPANMAMLAFELAMKSLSPGGSVVISGSNPVKQKRSLLKTFKSHNPREIYKTIIQINGSGEFRLKTVDIDSGCTVVQKGSSHQNFSYELSYDWLEKNRMQALNLVSWEEFWRLN